MGTASHARSGLAMCAIVTAAPVPLGGRYKDREKKGKRGKATLSVMSKRRD